MLSKFVIKYGDKAVYLIGGFIVLVFAVIMIVMFANTGEKTPATSQKVWDELVILGYEPAETTYAYTDQNSHLQKSIAIETSSIRFDFFEFDNDSRALAMFKDSHSQIYEKRSAVFRDWDEHYNNYTMYSMESDETYYTVIRVGNTIIDAYCDAECTSELGKILVAIGYQDA